MKMKSHNYAVSLIKNRWPVTAVKVIREANGIGLKEALDWVHAQQRRLGILK